MRLASLFAVGCAACGGGAQSGLSAFTSTGAVSNISPHDTCSDSKGYDILWIYLSSHFTSAFLAANQCTFKASSTDVGIAQIAVNAAQPHAFVPGTFPIDMQTMSVYTVTL